MVTLAEYEASCGEFVEEEEEEKEVYLNDYVEEVEEGPDEGELLVIRKALSGLASQDGDVYLQGDHIHSFSPTSWEAGSIQTHAW